MEKQKCRKGTLSLFDLIFSYAIDVIQSRIARSLDMVLDRLRAVPGSWLRAASSMHRLDAAGPQRPISAQYRTWQYLIKFLSAGHVTRRSRNARPFKARRSNRLHPAGAGGLCAKARTKRGRVPGQSFGKSAAPAAERR